MSKWKQAVGGTCVLWMVVASSAWAERPTMHPNTMHYRERNPAAATGRSGNASLAARALLSKATGETVMDITTGALDEPAGNAPGTLSRVQIKGYGDGGDLRWTVNHNGLTGGGTAQYRYQRMNRGQPFQVQGNIQGIDGTRTDVVTVSGNVRLRPDLKVVSISAPTSARVGAPVNIAATITEMNGDTGATADCLLYTSESSEPVDRANGVWVDGGDTVSCVFTRAFQAAGTQTIRVAVAGAVPADDDPSNDQGTVTVDVVNGNVDLWWFAQAYGGLSTSHSRAEGFYQLSSGTWSQGSDWSDTWDDTYAGDQTYFYASASTEMQFPLASFDVTHVAEGNRVLASIHRTNVPADWSWGYDSCGMSGVMLFDSDSSMYTYVNTYHCYEYASTYITSTRYAGTVSYFASGYSHTWYRDAGYNYDYSWAYNYGYSYSYGGDSSGGAASVTMPFKVVDAAGQVFQATPSVDLVVTPSSYSSPWSCYEYSSADYYDYAYRYCSEYNYSSVYWSGFNQGMN